MLLHGAIAMYQMKISSDDYNQDYVQISARQFFGSVVVHIQMYKCLGALQFKIKIRHGPS